MHKFIFQVVLISCLGIAINVQGQGLFVAMECVDITTMDGNTVSTCPDAGAMRFVNGQLYMILPDNAFTSQNTANWYLVKRDQQGNWSSFDMTNASLDGTRAATWEQDNNPAFWVSLDERYALVGTESGLHICDLQTGQWSLMDGADGINQGRVQAITELSNGDFLIGAWESVQRLSGFTVMDTIITAYEVNDLYNMGNDVVYASSGANGPSYGQSNAILKWENDAIEEIMFPGSLLREFEMIDLGVGDLAMVPEGESQLYLFYNGAWEVRNTEFTTIGSRIARLSNGKILFVNSFVTDAHIYDIETGSAQFIGNAHYFKGNPQALTYEGATYLNFGFGNNGFEAYVDDFKVHLIHEGVRYMSYIDNLQNMPAGTFSADLVPGVLGAENHFIYELVAGEGDDHNNLFEITGNTLSNTSSIDFSSGTGTIRIRATSQLEEGVFADHIVLLSACDMNEGSDAVVICDSYDWNGVTYNTTGHYTQLMTNAVGCDSLATLELTILKSTSGEETVVACDEYTWEGDTYTQTGTYIKMLTNYKGCDSTATLNLTMFQTSPTTTATCGVVWENDAWSNGAGPSSIDSVIIKGNYSTLTNGTFEMDHLTITSDDTIFVDPGTTLDITGNFINNGYMVVEPGGSLLTYVANNYEGGPITIKRSTRFASGGYSMVGIPVNGESTMFGNMLGPIVYTYDESIPFLETVNQGLDRWVDARDSVLTPGVGYAVAGDSLIEFTGIPISGVIWNNGLTRTEDNTTGSENWGWHLVSNPYPAAIDFNSFITTNTEIQGFIALWDDPNTGTRGDNSDYLIVNAVGAVTGPNGGAFSGSINAMQGFFVQVGEGQSGQFVFSESMRVAGNNSDNNIFRKASFPSFKLSVASGNRYSETLIGFPEDATMALDRLYDAARLKSQEELNIYSIINNEPMAIQGLPMQPLTEIALGLDHQAQGLVTLTLKELKQIPESYAFYLHNTITGEHIRLSKEGEPIQLSLPVGSDIRDYSIVLSQGPLQTPDIEPKFQVYSSGMEIIIKHRFIDHTNYQLMDMNGQLIDQGIASIRNNEARLSQVITNGIYLLQLWDGRSWETHKILMNN